MKPKSCLLAGGNQFCGDAVAGRKFSKIYIDHTVGSKKTNSGRESYDDFRTFYFLCMERYLFIRVIMP